jgi:hypothetical protein
MAQVASPYGFRPVKMLGDVPYSGGLMTYRLTAGANGAMFFGDPIGLVAGQPAAVTTSPTATITANSPIGIFMGCAYQDPTFGFVNRQYLPANAIAAGFKEIVVKVFDSPWGVFQVQADGPVTVDKVGLNAPWVSVAGNIATGDSNFKISAAGVATTTGLAVRIYGFPYTPAPSPGSSSQPGDPFTDCLVVWTPGIHRLMGALGQ